MKYQEFRDKLYSLKEDKYQEFSSMLCGSILKRIGVRIPVLKSLVKEHVKDNDLNLSEFILNDSIEETLCYLILGICRCNTFTQQMNFLEINLKYAVAWELTDTIGPYIKKSTFEDYKPYYVRFVESKDTFVRRFGYVYAMKYYQNGEIDVILSKIKNDNEYYVVMAEAWLLATCAITHFDEVLNLLKRTDLDIIIKRKTISKICDSYRIKEEQKNVVKKLREYL